MVNSKQKGSGFERTICKALSLWWSDGERDDIFWRSQNSGARATVRAGKGKQTSGQHGDLAAMDNEGISFTNACCVEFKVGYEKWSVLDVVDKPNDNVAQVFEQFMVQVKGACENAGAEWPVLICKRDRRSPVIIIPKTMYEDLEDYYGKPKPLHFYMVVRFDRDNYEDMLVLRLDTFFDWADAWFFKENYTVEN